MSLAMPQKSVMDGAVRHLVTNYNPKGNRVGWLLAVLDPGRSLGPLFDRLRPRLHQGPVPSRPAAARPRGGRHAGRGPGRGAARRLAVRQGWPPCHVPRHHGAVHRPGAAPGLRHERGLARRRAVPARRAARQRHLQRLHLHHGIDAQGAARGHGQPLAVHVRGRRGVDAGRHRGIPPGQCRSRTRVAHHAGASARCRLW